MIGPWFLCGTVFVCSFLIAATTWYSGFFLLSIVTRFACDIGHDLDLGFIWGHHHLHLVCLVSLVGMNDQSTSYMISRLATPCWRDPTRSKQLSTVAILGFQFELYHVVVPLIFLRSISLASLFSSAKDTYGASLPVRSHEINRLLLSFFSS